MSLETVLKIGKALRGAENNLKYFKPVESCPKDKDGSYPFCINLPIKEDFSFDWENIDIVPERQRGDLYYFKFKTSSNDNQVKYLFGDIFYSQVASINKYGIIEKNSGGFYKLSNPTHTSAAQRKSSFNRGFGDFEDIIKKRKKKQSYKNFTNCLKVKSTSSKIF